MNIPATHINAGPPQSQLRADIMTSPATPNPTVSMNFPPQHQRGAALFTALVLLVVVTLIALASLNVSLLEMRMSSNEETRMTAFQSAQSAIDNVIQNNATAAVPNADFTSISLVGQTNCTASVSGTCNYRTLALNSPLDGTSSGSNRIIVTRLTGPIDARTTSGSCNKSSRYLIESTVDKSTLGMGRSELAQGYMVCEFTDNPAPPPPDTYEHN